MTDTNTENQNISTTPDSEEDVVNKKRKKSSRLLVIIALIFIIILLCIIGYGFYFYKNNVVNNTTYQQKIETLASKLESQVTQQNTQFLQSKSLNDNFKTQIERLNIQLLDAQNKSKLYSSDMEALQRSVAETNIRHPSDWILSEVEYLINLSGRKLWLEHDLKSTIALLSTADKRIVEMGDPSLNPLRRALLEDINMLEALPQRDVDGVILALSSLERRIDKLVVAGLEVPEINQTKDKEVSDDVADWEMNVDKSWNSFIESFIVISHRDKPVEALLSPEQSWYLKENLRNALSKAEFAVYREQQDIYDLALQNALKLVALYYDMEDKSTQQFYTSVKRLTKQNVSIDYPDQFKSAPLLSSILKQRISKSFTIENAE
ncbi:uroporphyrinogen-III C-methyltransferase [Psychromonas sp. SP041]|uniref:uroporphyrinogen-III C-methyltransferase n=1 Tax=Psychromonas sp. SP041 TaxID=1365007 RepID=UPI0004276043|nr:uroporphyrinogen-III C-methyltransferase [Psychromonas sp. SP041]